MSSKLILEGITIEELLDGLIAKLDPVLQQRITQAMEKKEGEQLLSPAEACAVFVPSISKPTLESWSKKYDIKKYTLGGRCFYKKSEILEAAKSLIKYK